MENIIWSSLVHGVYVKIILYGFKFAFLFLGPSVTEWQLAHDKPPKGLIKKFA